MSTIKFNVALLSRTRRGMIDYFEKAVLPGLTEEKRRSKLHFEFVGGGPTGVEFAAELHDFIQEDIIPIYPTDGIDVQTGVRVTGVSDKDLSVKIKSTGEVCSIPHGLQPVQLSRTFWSKLAKSAS